MTAALRAELLKLRTTRIGPGLFLAALVLTALYCVLLGALSGQAIGGTPATTPGPDDPAVLRSVYGVPLSTGYILPLVIGILGMAGEYRHQTITPSLLAVPRRGRLVAAKLLAFACAGLAMGAAMTAVAVATGAATIAARGYPVGLGASGVGRTLLLDVLGVAIWTVFGLGLGTLIRNQVAAIVVALASQLIVEQLLVLGLNNVPHGGQVAQFLPSAAASAMVSGTSGGLSVQLLPWWGGTLVLLGWGVVLAAFGQAVTTRRDVT